MLTDLHFQKVNLILNGIGGVVIGHSTKSHLLYCTVLPGLMDILTNNNDLV